jgi:L,D-transpeptidase YcbB
MRPVKRRFGWGPLCAAVLLGLGLTTNLRAEEAVRVVDPQAQAASAATIPEPELPPDANAAPVEPRAGAADTQDSDNRIKSNSPEAGAAMAQPAPTDAAKASTSAQPVALSGADTSNLAKTDPEGVPPAASPGASPNDIAVAIAALPPSEAHGAAVAGLRDWRRVRDGLEAFYVARGDLPVFTDDKGFNPKGKAAIVRLNRADDDGIDLSGLAIPEANETIEEPERLAKAEIAVAEAIVAYAVEASGGRIDPIRVSPLITAKAVVADPEKALAVVAEASDPDEALASFNPPQKGYRELRGKLAALRAAYPSLAMKEPSGEGRAEGPAPLIRADFDRPSAMADRTVRGPKLAAAQPGRLESLAPGGRLEASLAEAVARQGARQLQAAILANMEMWRWEPRDMGEERIEVNVPDFSLRVLKGDETLHRARIIVGKPETQTPIFSNAMRYILVNPSWTVPPSIIKKEMLPKLAKDPDYLTDLGYEVIQHGDTITVKQPPGEDNALGRIAFMFPNEHSVYLHDTPSRSLFASPRRAFSHGCVRVDQPMALAEIVMGAGWSERRLDALVGGEERTLMLPHPVPIHIEYFTAFVDSEGALQLRDDLYGHTRRVESLLGAQS